MPTQSSSSSTRTAADVREKAIERVKQFYRPGKPDPVVVSRKQKFEAILRIVADHGGAWIVSVPGAAEVVIETLPGSSLLDELRELGLDPKPADPPIGERIIAGSIIEKFARAADGELVPLTVGSTLPVAEVRRHAGIVKVQRYSFGLP